MTRIGSKSEVVLHAKQSDTKNNECWYFLGTVLMTNILYRTDSIPVEN